MGTVCNTYSANINFDGVWTGINTYDNSTMHKLTLNQNDSTLKGSYLSKCGLVTISGSAEENKIGLNLTINTTQNNCPRWISLTATCSNDDCSVINGQWYDSNHLMGNLTWIKEAPEFYISSPENGSKFFIDTQIKMPSLNFHVTNTYPTAPIEWSLKLDFHWRRGRTSVALPATIMTSNDYTPDFNTIGTLGGSITTTAIYNPNDKNKKIAIGNYLINGTNPGLSLIEQTSIDKYQFKIACVESSYRQFDSSRENGQGLPLIGENAMGEKIGGVGIMQVIHKPISPATVWNWRANMDDGLKILNEDREKAKRLHINERIRLNADRKKLGLPSCPPGIPYPLTSDQITRDSIRRYNYGVEYRWEPRDAKDCAGEWKIEPSCVRHPLNGCDKDYVNKVLMCIS